LILFNGEVTRVSVSGFCVRKWDAGGRRIARAPGPQKMVIATGN